MHCMFLHLCALHKYVETAATKSQRKFLLFLAAFFLSFTTKNRLCKSDAANRFMCIFRMVMFSISFSVALNFHIKNAPLVPFSSLPFILSHPRLSQILDICLVESHCICAIYDGVNVHLFDFLDSAM